MNKPRALIFALNPQVVTLVADQLKDHSTTLQPAILINPTGTSITPLVRAWRTLLLGPALFRFDDPSAFAELLAHADAIANELLESFGWLLDIHRDYACIVRASGTTSGPVTSLTPFGTNDQIALFLCKAMRDQVESGAWSSPDTYGCLSWPRYCGGEKLGLYSSAEGEQPHAKRTTNDYERVQVRCRAFGEDKR